MLSNVLKLHGGIAVPWKNNNGAEVIKEEDENYEEDIRRNALLDKELISFSVSLSDHYHPHSLPFSSPLPPYVTTSFHLFSSFQ